MSEAKVGIKIRNLNIAYGGHKGLGGNKRIIALKNINLDIPGNKLTAIIGPSGCGKSTLLKTLNRLLETRDNVGIEGKVYIGGEDIYHAERRVPELREKVGLVDQRPYPLPASIYGNVAYGPRIHKNLKGEELDGIVESCLKRVHLWKEVKDRLNQPAIGLSIGQQQRLCLARALAVEPEVILCDEVTSALDPISSKKIEDLLMFLKENYTVIMVSHVLRQARRLADYVVFLYLGEVIETGDAARFFSEQSHELSKKYIKGLIAGV